MLKCRCVKILNESCVLCQQKPKEQTVPWSSRCEHDIPSNGCTFCYPKPKEQTPTPECERCGANTKEEQSLCAHQECPAQVAFNRAQIRAVEPAPEYLEKEWHACSTGDCPHSLQTECDAQLARDYPEPAAESAARERAVKNYVYPNFVDVEAIHAFRAGWDIRDAEIGKLKAELKEAIYVGTQNHDAALALTARVAELECEREEIKANLTPRYRVNMGLDAGSATERPPQTTPMVDWIKSERREYQTLVETLRARVAELEVAECIQREMFGPAGVKHMGDVLLERDALKAELTAMKERAEKAEASLSQRTVENLKQIKQRLLKSKKPADFVVIDALLNELDTIEERDALKAELAQARADIEQRKALNALNVERVIYLERILASKKQS